MIYVIMLSYAQVYVLKNLAIRGGNMKLVIIFGAGAVGKMTVGQSLAAVTDLRLYHNHMDIEMVLEIFGTLNRNAGARIREVIFEEFAKLDDQYGMIFTYVWAFDRPSDWDYIAGLANIFEQQGADIYWVELVADTDIRMARNVTENRLHHKASKRNIEWSNAYVQHYDSKYRLVSQDGEIPFANYIKIDNSHLTPDQTAGMIKDYFAL